jgi:hypothetical protein
VWLTCFVVVQPDILLCPFFSYAPGGMEIQQVGTPIVVHYSDRWHSVVVRDLIKTNKTSSNKFTIEFQDSNKPDVTLQLTYAPNVLPSNNQPTSPTQGHFFFEKGSTPLLPPVGSRILPGEFVRFDVGVVAGRGSQLKLASKAFRVTSVLTTSTNRLFYQGSENVYTLEKKYPLSPVLSVSLVPDELPENWVKHAMTNSRFRSLNYYVNSMTGESFYGKCETMTEKVLGETKSNDRGETKNGADETIVLPERDVSRQMGFQEVVVAFSKVGASTFISHSFLFAHHIFFVFLES